MKSILHHQNAFWLKFNIFAQTAIITKVYTHLHHYNPISNIPVARDAISSYYELLYQFSFYDLYQIFMRNISYLMGKSRNFYQV